MQRRRIGGDGASRLGEIDLFASLSLGQRRMLAQLVDELVAGDGEVLMTEGEAGFEFMILEQGTAETSQRGEPINAMGPGDFFGELAIISGGAPRTATVVATSDVRALAFTAHFMREMRERLPAVGEQIDRIAQQRVDRDAQARAGDAHARAATAQPAD
jgi:CRP/FNR family cyclic AMP-dependent transcriptional regulator